MKTIKVIDLINMVAKGEEVPNKVKFDDKEWTKEKGEKKYNNHTRNQRRMFRIKKQEEKINDLKLLVGNLQSQLDIANKKLEKEHNRKIDIKEYINKNIRHEYRNGRNNEFYLELNENKLKQLLSIIGGKDEK